MKVKTIILLSLILTPILSASKKYFELRELSLLDFVSKTDVVYSAKNHNVVDLRNFENKHITIFFTATWCLPCKKTAEWVERVHSENNENYEVIVISYDSGKKLTDYMNLKPNWHYVKYDRERVRKLNIKASQTNIPAIPTLITWTQEGEYKRFDHFTRYLKSK